MGGGMDEGEEGEREKERAQLILDRTAQETSIPTLLSSAKLSLSFFSAMEHCLSSCRDMDPTPNPPDPSSTDAYDLQPPSGITIILLVKIYSLKTRDLPSTLHKFRTSTAPAKTFGSLWRAALQSYG